MLAATGITVDEIAEIARRNPGARHIRRLRRVLTVADGGAESPQETRLRLLLVREGFPRPITQIPIRNARGRIVRRIDLGWPQWKVGIEYDGAQHWTDAAQHAGDIDRLEFLAHLGWRIVRVSSNHLKFDPAGIVRRTRTALKDAGFDG
ncbi:endonuclease domain-containing protein [Mycolicibacterium psychrotolerans]|uniref:endonuclease domain-containing protein n=1 Tax=Mycolicibacterium psychrotolerans TaxID=216929 RepID=UPI003D6680F8